MDTQKYIGRITYINTDRGFGFASSNSFEKDIFFHARHTKEFEFLEKGEKVSFIVEESAKGLLGKEVTRFNG